VANDPPGAIDRYVTLLEEFPTDRIALNNLAVAYQIQGRDDGAAGLYLTSVRLGGAPSSTYAGAISLLYAIGDPEGVRAILREFERTHGGNPLLDQYRLSFSAAEFDFDAAAEAANDLMERARGTLQEVAAHFARASIRMVQGRVAEARSDLRSHGSMRPLGGRIGPAS